MRKFFTIAFILAMAGAAQADEAKSIKVELSWRISLDAQGHVTTLQTAGKQPVDRVPQIRSRLEQEIRGWQFTSGKLDGQSAPTETGLRIWVTIVPQDNDTVRMHVEKASTGVSIAHMAPPHYPPNAVMKHETGQVVLRIGYDASGKVTSAELDPSAPVAPLSLVKASISAAQAWTFQPETVGGHALAGHAITPFCYTLVHDFSSRVEGKCDWKRPDTSESVGQGQALAVNPAARLQTDVAGRAL